jgi:hypothetical protein
MNKKRSISAYQSLTTFFNQAKRHRFPYKESEIPKNGIYIIFEKGEKQSNLDRVVRIGSHNGDNRLFARIDEHFIGGDHRSSIFRKHLGRCFLAIDKRTDYLLNWDLKIKKKVDKARNLDKIDWVLEAKYERKLTDYIRNNFSFILIEDLTEKVKRKRLEEGLIATFAQSDEKIISKKWLGKFHPDRKIRASGLWNIQHINGRPLNEEEVKVIQENSNQNN